MDSFIKSFAGRPILSLMLVSSFAMLGIISILRLPVGLLPDLSSAGVTIITRWPGVSARKIEEIVTIPVERQVSDVAGIKKILSTSSDGESRVNLLFDYDSEIKVKILDVSEKLYQISDRFPREIEEPSIVQYDPSDRPIFIVSFSSTTHDLKKLREIIDKKAKIYFKRIEGISEVFVSGGFEREIQVLLDPDRFLAHSMNLGPVINSLGAGNSFLPAGRVPAGSSREITVYSANKYETVEQINTLIVPDDEKSVNLTQLGIVEDKHRSRDTISRTNGQDRVTLYIQKAGNVSTLEITKKCNQVISSLPFEGIQSHIVYDQGKSISDAIGNVSVSLIYGGIIAIFVLYAFLRKPFLSGVIGLTIPASILATLFFMYLSGFQIDIMTLSGLALGAGMLVDNSIVVSESIESASRRLTPFQACVEGTRIVFLEVVSATSTTLIIFLPLYFTDPETRRLYFEFSMTVTYSLIISLVFSVTVLPAFIFIALKRENSHPLHTEALAGIAARGFDLVRAYTGRLSPRLAGMWQTFRPHAIRAGKKLNLHNMKSIQIRFEMILMHNVRYTIIGLVLLFSLGPFLFGLLKKENRGPADSREIEATVDLSTGIHLDKTAEVVSAIEESLRSHPAIEEITAKIEKWHATLNIKTAAEGSGDPDDLIDEFKAITDPNEDAFVYYQSLSEADATGELDIDFYGDDLSVLKKFASESAGRIRDVEGVRQVVLRFREPKTEIVVNPDPVKSAQAGASASEIGSIVRQFLSGTIITKFYDKDREVDVRLVGADESLKTPEKIMTLAIPVAQKTIFLSSLARFSTAEEETKIWRKNKRKIATITAVSKGRSLDLIAADIEKIFGRVSFPPDVIYAFSDTYLKLKKAQTQMLFAILLSILAIYLLLGGLFESFSQPFLILLTIPVTLAALIVFLSIFRISVTMNVYLGIMLLGGIVVNNSILVVSTINRRLRSYHFTKPFQIIRPLLLASSSRLRPILMTTLTTIFGMLPMVLSFSEGADLWRPFAITVVFGMTFALFVSLALTPFASYLYYRSMIQEI